MANATKAESWLESFSVAKTTHGGPAQIAYYTIASGETIRRGDPLVLNAGEVEEAADDSGALLGIAAAAGDAGDEIPVYVATRETIFVVQADGDISSKTYPFECDIVSDGGTGWLADIGSSVEDVLHVIEPVPGDDADDTTDPPRVYCQIKRSQWDELVAAR